MLELDEQQVENIRKEAFLLKFRYGKRALERVIKAIDEGRIQWAPTFDEEQTHTKTGAEVHRAGCVYGHIADINPSEDEMETFHRGLRLQDDMRCLLATGAMTYLETVLQQFEVEAGHTPKPDGDKTERALYDLAEILNEVHAQEVPVAVIELHIERKGWIYDPVVLEGAILELDESTEQNVREEAHLIKLAYGASAVESVIKGTQEGRIQQWPTFANGAKPHSITGEPVHNCGCAYGLIAHGIKSGDPFDIQNRGQDLQYEMRELSRDVSGVTPIENALMEYRIQAGDTPKEAKYPPRQRLLHDLETILTEALTQEAPASVTRLYEKHQNLAGLTEDEELSLEDEI